MPTSCSRQCRVEFWQRVRAGSVPGRAAVEIGVDKATGRRWFRQAGGVISNGAGPVSGRYLSFAEREEIAVGLAAGESIRSIAARLCRDPSTISREVRRNSTARVGYRAWRAEQKAGERARRPKTAKLAADFHLRSVVQDLLCRRWSPEQIALWLRREFPDDEGMRVSHETIYQSLYVQGRGALRRELTTCLRTGRALRQPQRHTGHRRGRIPGMVNISQRPAEATDRAVPGHWEGDLIIGRNGRSAIGTLVERTTRFCLLIHLPHGQHAAAVRDAMIPAINQLPQQLRRSLTWDQGREMMLHTQISTAADIDIYFCDPHSPWQRGTNENTNGLLRQFFPKGTDLAQHTPEHLAHIAHLLNTRPRKTLGVRTPAEALNDLLSAPPPHTPDVATTG